MHPRAIAFLIAASSVILIYVGNHLYDRGSLFRGADGRPSTSKAQWWIWTAVGIFGYIAVFAERCLRGNASMALEVPQNLLIAMGFSGATMITARAVTAAHVARGLVDKTRTSKDIGGIVTDDDG